jgi:hypothetical protein
MNIQLSRKPAYRSQSGSACTASGISVYEALLKIGETRPAVDGQQLDSIEAPFGKPENLNLAALRVLAKIRRQFGGNDGGIGRRSFV